MRTAFWALYRWAWFAVLFVTVDSPVHRCYWILTSVFQSSYFVPVFALASFIAMEKMASKFEEARNRLDNRSAYWSDHHRVLENRVPTEHEQEAVRRLNRQMEAIISHHDIVWLVRKRLRRTQVRVDQLSLQLEQLIKCALDMAARDEAAGRAFLSYVFSHINLALLLKYRLPLWESFLRGSEEEGQRVLRLFNTEARAHIIKNLQETDDICKDPRKVRV